jgi:hypothetical protein
MRVNYLAVLVAGLVYFFLGFLWYGVIFNKAWMQWEFPLTPATANHNNVPLMYLCSFVLGLVMCYVLALICDWRGANALTGALLGILMWVGFVLPTSYAASMFEGRPKHLYAINYGYCLVGMILAGLIVGGWRRRRAAV